MEESRALSKLNEAADLLILLEDVLNPASMERLSQASWSGLRLTLKSARSILQESQVSLSREFVARARNSQTLSSASSTNIGNTAGTEARPPEVISPIQVTDIVNSTSLNGSTNSIYDKSNSDQSRVQITRRDLKASLEKFIETRS